MLFNSLAFVIFFPIVTAIYFFLPHRHRVSHLLVASCVFYMFFVPKYILILFALIIIDYVAGIFIEGAIGGRRKACLIVSLVMNLGILFIFKYFNFVSANLEALIRAIGLEVVLPHLNMILPIGLSFHTFQSMSYTIEVFRGRQKATHDLKVYALYVLFYPQLVAGPIERPQNLIHQFYEVHRFDQSRLREGLAKMAWGLFKKVAIADRLAVFVNQVFVDPQNLSGAPLLIAYYFFAIQIYCDFSGYSDIARGAAHCMGFKLMENFNKPYFAHSISDFWRRWHISLSTWFRDYVYLPLGGSKVSMAFHMRNVMIVFLLSGVWHGANWTFLIWGLLHGFFMMVELAGRYVGGLQLAKESQSVAASSRLNRVLKVIFTFHLVALAWVFFRANTVADAWYVITHLIPNSFDVTGVMQGYAWSSFALPFVLILFLLAVEGIQSAGYDIWGYIARQPRPIRWGLYYLTAVGFLILVVMYGLQAKPLHFIYFQF